MSVCLTTLYALNTPKIISENKQTVQQGQVYKLHKIYIYISSIYLDKYIHICIYIFVHKEKGELHGSLAFLAFFLSLFRFLFFMPFFINHFLAVGVDSVASVFVF